MSERRATRRKIVLATAAALVTAGVIVTVLTVLSGLPDKVYDLDKACGGGTYRDASPYAGSAPHPVAIFMPSDVGQLLQVTPSLPSGSSWAPGDPEDPAAVQLLACGTLEGERRSDDLVCGGYGAMVGRSITVPMARATYQIHVYELRTHREVRSADVEGENTECPSAISANYTPDRFLSALTDVQWQSLVADLVDATPR